MYLAERPLLACMERSSELQPFKRNGELCSQCHPFFFNCFYICRLGTGQDKGARRTLTYTLLLAVASLFQQVRNVRSSEGSLSAAFAPSEPKTIHGTFSTIEKTCWWCEVKSFSGVWGCAGRSDTSIRRWRGFTSSLISRWGKPYVRFLFHCFCKKKKDKKNVVEPLSLLKLYKRLTREPVSCQLLADRPHSFWTVTGFVISWFGSVSLWCKLTRIASSR